MQTLDNIYGSPLGCKLWYYYYGHSQSEVYLSLPDGQVTGWNNGYNLKAR